MLMVYMQFLAILLSKKAWEHFIKLSYGSRTLLTQNLFSTFQNFKISFKSFYFKLDKLSFGDRTCFKGIPHFMAPNTHQSHSLIYLATLFFVIYTSSKWISSYRATLVHQKYLLYPANNITSPTKPWSKWVLIWSFTWLASLFSFLSLINHECIISITNSIT
jgi:hypothetical protein